MNTPPPPPDDSYVVMQGKHIPRAFVRRGLKRYNSEWSDSYYNFGDSFQDRHPADNPHDADEWYAVPKSAMPEERPAKPEPDADGWIPHTPGDPCPCGPNDSIDIKLADEFITRDFTGSKADWGKEIDPEMQIIAWRPHKPASSTISGALSQQLDEKDAIIAELNERLQERTEALLLQQELFTKEIRELRKQLKQVARATKPV